MLVMTDELQKFIDEQVFANSEEIKHFLNHQAEQMLEKDPEGHRAEPIIRYWFESKQTPVVLADKLRLMFACHVFKTLHLRRYIQESKAFNYWQLVSRYQRGNTWQQQTACGEIAYRVHKNSTESEFIEWLSDLLKEQNGQEVMFLLETPERINNLAL